MCSNMTCNLTDTLTNVSRFPYTITPQWYLGYDMPLLIFYVFVMICGLGNWFVLCCILMTKKLRRVFNSLVVALAAVYGILTTALAPMEIVGIINHFLGASHGWCKTMVIIRTGVFYSSIFIILNMGVVRLIHGIKTTKLSLCWYHMVLVFALIIGATVPLTMVTSLDGGIPMLLCRGQIMELIWLLRHTSTWTGVFIPTVVMFSCTVAAYVVLIGVLIMREKAFKRNPNTPKQRPHIVTSKVAFGVILGFTISYLAPFLSKLLQVLGWSPTLDELPHNLAVFNAAMYIQAAMHPAVYLIETTEFKRSLRLLLGLCHIRRTTQVVPLGQQHEPSTSFRDTLSVPRHKLGVRKSKPRDFIPQSVQNETQRY